MNTQDREQLRNLLSKEIEVGPGELTDRQIEKIIMICRGMFWAKEFDDYVDVLSKAIEDDIAKDMARIEQI